MFAQHLEVYEDAKGIRHQLGDLDPPIKKLLLEESCQRKPQPSLHLFMLDYHIVLARPANSVPLQRDPCLHIERPWIIVKYILDILLWNITFEIRNQPKVKLSQILRSLEYYRGIDKLVNDSLTQNPRSFLLWPPSFFDDPSTQLDSAWSFKSSLTVLIPSPETCRQYCILRTILDYLLGFTLNGRKIQS